jgi:DNA-binding transcriptional LysR family regulator
MDIRRLELLLHLSRTGSMRAVSEEIGVTTSTVSQQIGALARDVGTPLLEHVGRGVRLTPAGRRLADHAVTILAAVDAARVDLDPTAEPSGTLRVAGFATAVRRSLLPLVADLATQHPAVHLQIHEHEPFEALSLLSRDDVDLALTYDYDLAPADTDPGLEVAPLWTAEWGLGVPIGSDGGGDAVAVFAEHRDRDWVVNSRNTADEQVVRVLGAMAGFRPHVRHRVDSLELVQDLIRAGLGVGLLPVDQPTADGVTVLPLAAPAVTLRAFAVVRRGRASWPPLAVVLEALGG